MVLLGIVLLPTYLLAKILLLGGSFLSSWFIVVASAELVGWPS